LAACAVAGWRAGWFTIPAVVAFVDALKGNPWAAPIFLALYFLATLLFPVSLLTVTGGVQFGFWYGLLLNSLASNLGAWAAFWIARTVGRDRVRAGVAKRWPGFEEHAKGDGFVSVLFVRLVGLPPYLIVNYGAGLSPVRFRDYALASVIGMTLWTAMFTFFSDALWNAFVTAGTDGFRAAIGKFAGPAAGIAVFIAAMVLLGQLLRRRTARP
jgi:uncharacterized membrane protein YdjX (TVP38/TMEM64 family)